MSQRLLIVGSGFAGFWAALSARALISKSQASHDVDRNAKTVEVHVVAPEARLVLRPRLYEPNPGNMSEPVHHIYRACGVAFTQGSVDKIDTSRRTIEFVDATGARKTLDYDRLVLAAGGRLVHPAGVSGLREHAFSVDQIGDAVKLEQHLHSLASRAPTEPGRNTVVVCGAGFSGIEVASELPARLRAILGADVPIRVVAVERDADLGPDLGPAARPHVREAFDQLGIETRLGSAVVSVDAGGVTLASGERIETLTAIWTAGVLGTPLAKQIPGEMDSLARLHVDKDLRVPTTPTVFVTGDAARAVADADGHCAKMSCQHALPLGKYAGYNAAADLLGLPALPYSQPVIQMCLDLGEYGSVIGDGWDLKIRGTGMKAKPVKKFINEILIYPPPAVAAQAFAAAHPFFDGSGEAADTPALKQFLAEFNMPC